MWGVTEVRSVSPDTHRPLRGFTVGAVDPLLVSRAPSTARSQPRTWRDRRQKSYILPQRQCRPSARRGDHGVRRANRRDLQRLRQGGDGCPNPPTRAHSRPAHLVITRYIARLSVPLATVPVHDRPRARDRLPRHRQPGREPGRGDGRRARRARRGRAPRPRRAGGSGPVAGRGVVGEPALGAHPALVRRGSARVAGVAGRARPRGPGRRPGARGPVGAGPAACRRRGRERAAPVVGDRVVLPVLPRPRPRDRRIRRRGWRGRGWIPTTPRRWGCPGSRAGR